MSDDEESAREDQPGSSFFVSSENHPRLRRASAIDEDVAVTTRRRGHRAPPMINVTREIEQTLARPAATRDSNESDPNEKNAPAAPSSETMC